MIALALQVAGAPPALRSTAALGQAEARCRPAEPGPALEINVVGLKDRTGALRAELYPDRDDDFLKDDNQLIAQGKTFRRVVEAPPASGPVRLCLRVPAAGAYALSLVHSRGGTRKFSLSKDGIGFASNPRLGLGAPKASEARIVAGPGLTATTIVMNYRRGLFSFGPL